MVIIHRHKFTLSLIYDQLPKISQTQLIMLFVGEMIMVINEILSNDLPIPTLLVEK